MKSKAIFIVLLFSLFFNISHDILIAHETAVCHTTLSVQESTNIVDTECCNTFSELHEIFHFSGILATFSNMETSEFSSLKVLFISTISPIFIEQTTFKPPIV
ncbi:hypothetical protein KKC13_11020 [bacterium]|nr:hypothetical protein [bacterium]MBU1958173.1 hypothetical protein [bacterium]